MNVEGLDAQRLDVVVATAISDTRQYFSTRISPTLDVARRKNCMVSG